MTTTDSTLIIVGYLKPFFLAVSVQIPSQFGVVFLVVPCFVLACIMHPNLNKDFLSDMAWTFSM